MEVLTIKQCAELLHMSVKTLYNMRSKKEGPKPLKGRNTLYARSDVERWLKVGV
jgi:excisionase family DNA binding protein